MPERKHSFLQEEFPKGSPFQIGWFFGKGETPLHCSFDIIENIHGSYRRAAGAAPAQGSNFGIFNEDEPQPKFSSLLKSKPFQNWIFI